jgi:hypothetical protein
MALENKKSLLQPSSTQAQQYRLQFSNLVPSGVTPAATAGGSAAPVTRTGGLSAPANARPAVSAFVQAPAPVSLQAPPTIPPALPVPAPAPAPTPPSVPIVYPVAGLFFDGNTYFSASLDQGNDFLFEFNDNYPTLSVAFPTARRTGIGFFFKPDLGASTSYPRRTIFHTYSGSFASQSFEIFTAGAYIHAEYLDNGKKYTLREGGLRSTSLVGNSGNGYTYVYFSLGNTTRDLYPADIVAVHNRYSSGDARNKELKTTPFTIEGNDHFYIGGSPLAANNFSGSISYLFFTSGSGYNSQVNTSLSQNTLKPENFSGMFRLYKFDQQLTDVTASIAEYSYPLELVTGTTTYVEGPYAG